MNRADPPSRRRLLGLLSGCALLPLAQACAGGDRPEVAEDTPAAVLDAEYQLGTDDELRVTVFGEENLTGEYAVGSQGIVAFPLVGEVRASGLTVGQFTEALQESLSAYIRRPIVSVEVINYRPFFILGEVQNPGTYDYSARLTVQNAVATAGGFTYRANRRRVWIRHAGEAEETLYVLDSSTPVLPGDTVRIAERIF